MLTRRMRLLRSRTRAQSVLPEVYKDDTRNRIGERIPAMWQPLKRLVSSFALEVCTYIHIGSNQLIDVWLRW